MLLLEPSMADLQTSYMNIVPPAIMQSGMDSVTSTYMPLHQSMPHTNNYMVNTSNYPHMSYSPVPQMFMANATNDAYGSAFSQPPTSMKMGYPDQSSNLTSMPVQTPTMPTSSDQRHLQQQQRIARRDSSSRSMASPTTPTHPPPPSATADGRYKHSPDSVPATSTPTTVTYIPKTRQVESYGGVDLKYFEKFEIRPAIPYLEELGAVDLTALTMSLRSGTKMEMTNALNTLTTMTMQPRPLLLTHCEDLLDIILDHLQGCLFDESPMVVVTGAKASSHSYADLFELALLEMKSLIPGLEPTSSETWLSSRELRLCLFNLLRNLSFMEENLDYLSKHPRLCPILINTVQLTRQYRIRIDKDDGNLIAVTATDDDDDDNNNNNNDNTNTNTKLLRCMDILEFRKCVLTIYANIAIAITTPQYEPDTMVDALVFLIHDFVVYGTDTYYAMLAMEAWNKFSVHDSHRRILGSLLHDGDNRQPVGHLIQGIWVALVSMIRRQFHLVEMGMMVGMSSGQLGTLELVMMGLYNVVALADLAFCEQLIEADPSVAMTLLRICLTLAEANNHHFRIVAQRGMETVYALILGGGVKVTHLVKQQQQYGRTYQQPHTARKQQQQQQQSAIVFPITSADLEDEELNYKKGVSLRATSLLNTTVLQEKLMMAMLKPSSDNFILSGLNDFLDLMADMSFYD
ncbi:hypothetical protein BCR42DRAFT_412600 [Absidia repens]|uniref:SWI/SNF-like complex subunit BAF250 C-terminal domain-containing protein n=1 Tax=Absidia repens TaxID=90262 RepID=A0A1X2IJU2_9FUNG|nr:hypothetical protein BCR42DRAFT_412600 [Absidia repens]